MAVNNKLKCLIFTTLFLSGVYVLHAQTAGSFLDPNSVEPRFIQRLAWSGGTNSLYCEVIIEKQEGGEYVGYMSKITNDNHFDITLPPGNYRFRVTPYDVLGKPSAGTQWSPFTVYNAVKPELYMPEELDYFNDKQGSKFVFNGNNIEPDAKIYFINSEGEQIVPIEVIRSDDGSSVRLVFDKGQLLDGEYEVFVVNPGGLETSLGGIDYKTYREKFGLMHYVLSVSFMPSYQVYREEFSPPGELLYYIYARMSVISCMFLDNYIGMEFAVSRFWDADNFLNESTSGFTTEYNLIFINWLPERKAAVNFKIGIGFDMQPMDLTYSTIGVSFMYRLFQKLNIEAGVNFIHSKRSESGNVLPWAGLCIIF